VTDAGASRPIVCVDADALIYAAARGDDLGQRIRTLFLGTDHRLVGSALLPAEVLVRPNDDDEADQLEMLLGQMEIWPITDTVGYVAAWLGSRYRLAPMNATHLACAIDGGADVFLTNNRKDFDKPIGAIDIVYPDELPAPKRSRR
jgi:predicted nucleic acid-binding protein